MSDKIRVSAKTKEDAITKALIQLHTTSDHLSYSVLVEGKKWCIWNRCQAMDYRGSC